MPCIEIISEVGNTGASVGVCECASVCDLVYMCDYVYVCEYV